MFYLWYFINWFGIRASPLADEGNYWLWSFARRSPGSMAAGGPNPRQRTVHILSILVRLRRVLEIGNSCAFMMSFFRYFAFMILSMRQKNKSWRRFGKLSMWKPVHRIKGWWGEWLQGLMTMFAIQSPSSPFYTVWIVKELSTYARICTWSYECPC